MKKSSWKSPDGKYQIEAKAFELAKNFLQYSDYLKYLKLSNITKTKWWQHFLKTIELHGKKKEWGARDFVKVQFDEFGQIYPFHLVSKKAWNTYIEFYKKGKADKDITIAKSLLNGYNKIKKWSKENGFDFINYKGFFEDKKNMFFINRKEFSLYFLTISKSFLNIYRNLTKNEKEDIISLNDFRIKRAYIFKNKKILNKIKEILGEEFR